MAITLSAERRAAPIRRTNRAKGTRICYDDFVKKAGKPKISKRPKVKARGLTIGLAGFAKISAIEGLHLTREMQDTFDALKRRGASPRQRRAAIVKKYGAAS